VQFPAHAITPCVTITREVLHHPCYAFGGQVTLHAHSGQETGVISRLVSLLNAKTGEASRQRPRCLLKVRCLPATARLLPEHGRVPSRLPAAGAW